MYAWIVVFLAIFLIGVTKSGFGSGVGLMIVPITAIAMGYTPYGSQAALGLLLPLLVVGDFIALYQYRRLFLPARVQPELALAASVGTAGGPGAPAVLDYAPASSPASSTGRNALRIMLPLLPGTAFGVVFGGLLLWWFHQQPPRILVSLIRIEIGFESILLVGIHWWRMYKGEQQNTVPEPLRSHLTGGFAATSSTLAHAAGPIIAMYLLPLHLDRQLFVATCAVYFFMLNTAKLPAYHFAGQFSSSLPWAVRCLPVVLVIAGAIFGYWLNRRMSDKLFTRVVYTITFILGWYMLIDGTLMFLKH